MISVEIGERIVASADVRGESAGMRTASAELPGDFDRLEPEARAAALGKALAACGVEDRRFTLVLPRRRAILRVLELPPGEPDELKQMIRYQLERELPVAVDEVHYSYVSDGSRVIVAAVPRTVLDPLLEALSLAGYRPAHVYISCFGLATWAKETDAIVALSDGHAEIVVGRGGAHLYSRSTPLRERTGPALATEIQRTILSYSATSNNGGPERVLLAGGGAEADALAREVSEALSRPVETLGGPDLGPESAAAAGVGLAELKRPGAIPDVIHPPAARRKFRVTRKHRIIAAAVTLVLAVVVVAQLMLSARERELGEIEGRLKTLQPRADAVREVMERTKLAREWDDLRYEWIDLLKDLSERIDSSKLYLTSVTVDERGVVRLVGKSRSEGAVNAVVANLQESRYFESLRLGGWNRNPTDKSEYRIDFTIEGFLEGVGEETRKGRK